MRSRRWSGIQAATVSWVGPAEGDWAVEANWSTGVLPGAGDDVVVDTGSPVAVTHAAGATQIASLNLVGTLRLAGGSLTLTQPSLITGTLVVELGAALSAVGSSATLSVSGDAYVSGGDITAVDGAHITLPGATRYAGSGLLRAEGPLSLLELEGLTNIGIPPPDPVTDIASAVSKEISVFLGEILNAGGPGLGIPRATSRELSVFNGGAGGNEDPEVVIQAAVSRELSVFNGGAGGNEDPEVVIQAAVSRELSVFNGGTSNELPSGSAVSRELSVENQAP